MERRLYEASLSGCVDTLNALLQADKLILDRVAVTWFHETPLHIAALRGHLHFTKALLNQKPKLATGLDSWRRSPLHLASAEGYDDIVQELLSVNLDMCNVRDGDGRIPLHLAVIKGRLGVIKKLITAQPNSTRETLDHGETILHLSVNCCCFEVLKLLVESVSDVDEFLNSQDSNGNTILHLASILKQQEIVKYLLSRSGVEANKNAMNENGFTALDVLEHCPRDVKGMEILYFLREAGVRRANELITPTITTTATPPQEEEEEVADHQHNEIVGPKKMSKIGKLMKYLSTSHGEKWYEETQQTLMLVATVLASMSFQAVMNPPGGVWQEDTVEDKLLGFCIPEDPCFAGTSVLAYSYPDSFSRFLIFNTGSLIASLSIFLLIISGFPLKNKFCMWLLILTMCMAVVFMALAYLVGMILVADRALPVITYGTALFIWLGIIGIVGLIFLARFLYWLVRKPLGFTLKMRSRMKNESRTLGA